MLTAPAAGFPEPTGPAWARLEDQLGWYDASSTSCQRSYRRTKVATLGVGAVVPVVAGLSAPAAVTASLAAVVVLLEGVQQLYQWQTNWTLYRATAEALKHERWLYLSQAGPYTGDERDQVLAERVEGLVSQEHARWTDSHTRSTERAAQ